MSEQLQQQWLELTRVALPGRARDEAWPLRNDHCFQRILLDAVCGGRWYDFVPKRPAYRHLTPQQLRDAVRLAQHLADDEDARAQVISLNAQSLRWRQRAANA